MIKSDPTRTQRRIRELQDYMRDNVLADDGFVCAHFRHCRESHGSRPFYEGQLSHVGSHYDLYIDGRPMRIVVVSQEYGHGPGRVGLRERSAMVQGSALAKFRGRNPHMKGTASMLRLLLGREPGEDTEGESLLDGHIFDGFALVNYLLCSALEVSRDRYDGGAGKGRSTSIMRENCSAHFVNTLRILDPTVIIVQGKAVRSWLADAFGLPKNGPTVEHVQLNGNSVDMLTFVHPSAGGSAGWWGNSTKSKYLREEVAPAIRAYSSPHTTAPH